MNPKYTERDTDDAVTAIRKVYPTIQKRLEGVPVKTVACLICCAAPSVFGAGLQAGVARVEITPREPIWMSGYASRSHPSTGIRQALWAKALAIQSGSGRPVVIVATDLVGLPAEVADEIAARAQRQFGIERSRLLVNSSHTHTGPVVWPGLAAMFDLPPGERTEAPYVCRAPGGRSGLGDWQIDSRISRPPWFPTASAKRVSR